MTDWSAKCFHLKAKSIRSKIYQTTANRRQNKAKGPISKRVFQENKARKIFQKTNISYIYFMHTYVCIVHISG